MWRVFFFLLLLLPGFATCQEATVTKTRTLLNVTAPRIIGNRLFVGQDTQDVRAIDSFLLTYPTGFKVERVRVKKNGTKAEGIIISEDAGHRVLLYTEPGTYSIDVILLDLEKGTVDLEEEVVLGSGPGPTPPGPDPEPEPPTPPSGPFNDIALRVSKVKVQDRTLWKATIQSLISKMTDFSIKTEQGIKTHLSILSDKEMKELISNEPSAQSLGWQDRIKFFQEVLKGL
jgi:hypothetical protein